MRKGKKTPTPASLIVYRSLLDLTPEESCFYLVQLIERLRAKQKREQAYLDRRASRGVRTPTDEVYESDQVLEQELIALLQDLLAAAKEGGSADAAI